MFAEHWLMPAVLCGFFAASACTCRFAAVEESRWNANHATSYGRNENFLLQKAQIPTASGLPGVPRPKNVPLDAIWVGGIDGGVYILLTSVKSTGSERYCAKVFNDFTGKVRFSGLVIRDPTMATPIKPTSPGVFAGWDSRGILLVDGTMLRSVAAKCPKKMDGSPSRSKPWQSDGRF
jgi:hypothetical protein